MKSWSSQASAQPVATFEAESDVPADALREQAGPNETPIVYLEDPINGPQGLHAVLETEFVRLGGADLDISIEGAQDIETEARGDFSTHVSPSFSPSVYVNGSYEGAQTISSTDDIHVDVGVGMESDTAVHREDYTGGGDRTSGVMDRCFHIPSVDPWNIIDEYYQLYEFGEFKSGYAHEINSTAANADHIYVYATGNSSAPRPYSGVQVTVYNTDAERIFSSEIERSVTIDEHLSVDEGVGAVHVGRGHGTESYNWTMHELKIEADVPTVTSVDISTGGGVNPRIQAVQTQRLSNPGLFCGRGEVTNQC